VRKKTLLLGLRAGFPCTQCVHRKPKRERSRPIVQVQRAENRLRPKAERDGGKFVRKLLEGGNRLVKKTYPVKLEHIPEGGKKKRPLR